MKVKAQTRFYDSIAKQVRNAGDIFDVTPSRYDEIVKKGQYVVALEEVKPKKAKKKKVEVEPNE